MSKLRAIAIAFSVVLLVLFATLIYLMTKINPPENEPGDNPNGTAKAGIKFDDADYDLNSNEALLSNDNYLRYGLEKVTGEYDVDAYGKIIVKLKPGPNNTDILKLLANNETQENCTSLRISETELVTQSVKGFRRSINEKEFLENEEYVPIALLMKINHLDGQPGIQFKVVSLNLKNQKNDTHKSTGNVTTYNSSSKINFETDSANNSIRSASIVMTKDGTLILNMFANAIDLIKENDSASYIGDDNTEKETDIDKLHKINTPRANTYYENDTTFITDSTHLNWQTEIESKINNTDSNPNMYTYNFINNNFTVVNISVTQNIINTEEIQQDASESIIRKENQNVTREFEDESFSIVDSEMESTVVTENADTVFVWDESNNSSNLVGVFISESTSNFPVD